MKVYYVNSQKTTLGQASYSHVFEIINGLKKRGCEVTLFQPNWRGNPKVSVLMRVLFILEIQIKVFLSPLPDIVYLRSNPTLILISYYYHLRKIPVVQEVNGTYSDVFLAWPITTKFKKIVVKLINLQYHWSDACIVVTSQLKLWLQNFKVEEKKIHIVGNGANTDIFYPNKTKIDLPESYVIFFGALAPWQGIDLMLDALNSSLWPSTLHLLIVGNGQLEYKVREMCKKNSKLKYLPSVDQHTLCKYISNSLCSLSVQVGSRNLESGLSPLKLFESMSCAVPVIVTRYPNIEKIVVQSKGGIVLDNPDANELASNVNYLYSNDEICENMGRNGREYVKNGHSWDRKAEETYLIFNQILEYS